MAQVQYDYAMLDTCIENYGFDKIGDLEQAYTAVLNVTGSYVFAWAVTDRLKQIKFYKGFCANLD
jgi:hypothetical protein